MVFRGLIFTIAVLLSFSSFGQKEKFKLLNKEPMENNKNTMLVEVWSDIVCPFCYLGKRKFETALKSFSHKNNVKVIWKSFQLMPDMKTDTSISIHDFLAREKGISQAQAKQMNNYVTQSGKEVGIDYQFDKAVVANTFRGHNLLHFAKLQGKQNKTKENLMKAYFTDGKNIDDIPTLIEIAKASGLKTNGLQEALENSAYAEEVQQDIYESQLLGVRGVPFFVFDRKYAISGAQDSSVFSKTLEKAFEEWKKENPDAKLEVVEGEICTPEGKCD